MPKQYSVDCGRRAVLGAGGALILGAALWPRRSLAQPSGGNKSRIGIIGSGHIGGTIGGLWVKAGHPVMFSSRHPEELKDLVAGLGAAGASRHGRAGDRLRRRRSSSPCPMARCRRSASDYAAALKGKIVLDACNAVAARDGAIADEVERNGIGVTSQKYLPGTRLVRAFNTLSYMIFAREANRPDPRLAIPIAGDDAGGGAGRGRTGARCRLRSGGGRQAGGCEAVPARRSGLRPAGERGRAQAETDPGAVNAVAALAGRAVPATPQERAAALWSFAYFFTLLAGYYVLRPLRDQMGIAGGVKNLPWLFTATFVTLLVAQPLYGALVAKTAARALHPHRLSLLRRQPGAVLAAADARRRDRDRRARLLRLGQRVQPVRGRGVLVVHGRPVRRRAGQAAVRLHRRRRHRRRAARPGHHDRPVGAARPDQSADRRDRVARSWRCSASTGSSARRRRKRARQPNAASASAAAPSPRCPS